MFGLKINCNEDFFSDFPGVSALRTVDIGKYSSSSKYLNQKIEKGMLMKNPGKIEKTRKNHKKYVAKKTFI